MTSFPDINQPAPVVDELCRVRDEIGRMDHAGTGLLDRGEVLAYLRTEIDRLVFGAAE